MEGDDIEGEEIGGEEIDEEENEEQFYETIKYLLMAIQAIIIVLRETITIMPQRIERPLKRRPVTRKGYYYIHEVLKEDPQSQFCIQLLMLEQSMDFLESKQILIIKYIKICPSPCRIKTIHGL